MTQSRAGYPDVKRWAAKFRLSAQRLKKTAIDTVVRSATLRRLNLVNEYLTVGRSLIVNFSILVVTCAFGYLFFKSVGFSAVVVQPVPVPKSLSEAGFTPEIVAARVVAQMTLLRSDSQTRAPIAPTVGHDVNTKTPVVPIAEFGGQPDFELPGKMLSFQTLVRYAKDLFGGPPEVISIDVVDVGKERVAEIRYHRGKREGAVRAVRDSVELDPNAFIAKVAYETMRLTDPIGLASYEVDVEQRRCKGRSCDFRRALEVYDVVLAGTDDNLRKWAYMGRAYVFSTVGNAVERDRALSKALQIDPAFASARVTQGVALATGYRFEEAIELYKKAPHDPVALMNWAWSLSKLRNYAGADEKFRQSIKLDPGSADTYRLWGLSLSDRGEREAGIAKFERAAEIDSRSVLTYVDWGYVLLDMKRNDEAREIWQKALTLDASHPRANAGLGTVLFEQQKYEEALARFQQAVQARPGYWYGYLMTGKCLVALRQESQAVSSFQKVMEIYPNHPQAREELAKLLDAPGKAAELQKAAARWPAKGVLGTSLAGGALDF